MRTFPTLRQAIRLHTEAAHRDLEETLLMRAVASGSPSDSQYRDYLDTHLRLHAPLEVALRPWVPSTWDGVRLVKSQWLRDDLIALGSDAEPLQTDPVAITSEAQALGTLYVLEGATLGLQMLRKRIGAGSAGRAAASRFMLGYGESTGANWREFIDRLETLPQPLWPQVLGAAGDTFGAFQRRFAALPWQAAS